jgi:hypothetical protein
MSDQPETIDCTLHLRLPKYVALDVTVDTNGKVWPAIGLTFQRLLDAEMLVEMGVTVGWKMADGEVLDPDVARMLIASRTAEFNTGYVPKFAAPADPAKPAGDAS